jgi:hypothetical protein
VLLVLFAVFVGALLGAALAPGYWTLLLARSLGGAAGGLMGATVYTVIGIAGPLAGAAAVAGVGAPAVLAVDAASFAAASTDSGAPWANAVTSRESQAAPDFIPGYQQDRDRGGKAIFNSKSFARICSDWDSGSFEEFGEPNFNVGHARRRQERVAFNDESLQIAPAQGLTVNFNPALGREHDPVFLHTRLGIHGRLLPIHGNAADGDLDNKGRGGGVAGPEVLVRSRNDRDVGLRFRVLEGQRLVLPHGETGRREREDEIVEELCDAAVEGRLGHFLEDDSPDQFRALSVLVELGKGMVLRDRDR